MLILYGTLKHNIDVTSICIQLLKYNNYIIIPAKDAVRARFFTDPLPSVLKSIFVVSESSTTEYNDSSSIYIDIETGTVLKDIPESVRLLDPIVNLAYIQSKLNLLYGTFADELPEQKMAVRYLKGTESVLEIGGNIGRNSLIISSILKDPSKLVVLESDTNSSIKLKKNRDINGLNFHIENAALSKRKLIQKGWNTIVSDILLEGYKPVSLITYAELMNKYKIQFDTLVLDCEGAFYYILEDMPEVLNGINLIIMENDYTNGSHKEYIDDILKKNNFYVDYTESGGWLHNNKPCPCRNNFFEVWIRR
jgi:FkbM family methyltransferase